MLNIRFTLPVLLGLFVGISPLLAATDSVQKFDLERSCRAELSGGSPVGETMASCKAGQERARGELGPRWSSFTAADKNVCIRETQIDGTPSYVELETCLYMTSSGRKARKPRSGPTSNQSRSRGEPLTRISNTASVQRVVVAQRTSGGRTGFEPPVRQ